MPAANRNVVLTHIRVALTAFCIALVALSLSLPTHAAGVSVADATPEQKEAARVAYLRGKKAMDAGNMEEALGAFHESGATPRPTPWHKR